MKIAVVGPGALGCLFAALLARAGHHVWLLDHRPERAEQITRQGLVLHDSRGKSVVPIAATADPMPVGVVQLLLLCVKSEDVVPAVEQALPVLGPASLLLALQNGISHHHRLGKYHGQWAWALAVTAQGATLLGPGIVRHGGHGPTYLGALPPANDTLGSDLQAMADVFSQAGIATEVSADILAAAWNKLIVNVGINALTALEDCANGELLCRREAFATMQTAVQEAAAVAKAYGVDIVADPVALTVAVCRQTANNISSMLQDIRHRRRTEIEAINGEVVRLAAALGMAAPCNQALLTAIKALEAS